MIKNLGKIIVKGLILLALFFLVIIALESLFSESKKSVWSHFYAQEKNTIDILILGNSHANAGIDQDIIEAKLNANVVSLATRGQNIYQSYYCALEAYKYQTPEILIIENFLFYERLTMDAFVNQDPTINDYMKRYLTFEGKKFGKVKIEESRAFFKGNIIENMFPAIKNHHKWVDLKEINKRLYTKDSKVRRTVTTILAAASAEAYKTKSTFDLSTYNILPEEEKALKQIVDLAKKKGTKKIILLTIPFYKDYRNKIDYKSLDNPLKQFTNNNQGVSYIDLNTVYGDWDHTYFANDPVGYNQHLNYKGAIKVSNYLVDHIGETIKFETVTSHLPEYYLYNRIKKDSTFNNSRVIGNLETINSSEEIKYTMIQGHYPIVVDGWMAIEDNKSINYEMYLGLVKDKQFIYVTNTSQLKPKIRKDVTKYFKKEDGFYDNSGFHANIDSNLLEKGKYEIYMIIKKNNEIILKRTYKVVEIN